MWTWELIFVLMECLLDICSVTQKYLWDTTILRVPFFVKLHKAQREWCWWFIISQWWLDLIILIAAFSLRAAGTCSGGHDNYTIYELLPYEEGLIAAAVVLLCHWHCILPHRVLCSPGVCKTIYLLRGEESLLTAESSSQLAAGQLQGAPVVCCLCFLLFTWELMTSGMKIPISACTLLGVRKMFVVKSVICMPQFAGFILRFIVAVSHYPRE